MNELDALCASIESRKAALSQQIGNLDLALKALRGESEPAATSPRPPTRGPYKKKGSTAAAKTSRRPCGCGPLGRHQLECKLAKKPAAPAPAKKGPWGKKPKAAPAAAGDGATCESCGREGLEKSPGPGGYLRFHRAPCSLPCNGANLANLSAEDRADGTHSKKNCAKCGKAAGA